MGKPANYLGKGALQKDFDKPSNYVGEMVNNSSSPTSQTMEKVANTINAESAKNLISSPELIDKAIVEKILQVRVEPSTSWVEPFRKIMFTDSHFIKLNSDRERNVAFYRLFRNIVTSNGPESYEAMGIGKNLFDVPPGKNVDMTIAMSKDNLKGIYDNLNTPSDEEQKSVEYFTNHTKEIVDYLRRVSVDVQVDKKGFDTLIEALSVNADGTEK